MKIIVIAKRAKLANAILYGADKSDVQDVVRACERIREAVPSVMFYFDIPIAPLALARWERELRDAGVGGARACSPGRKLGRVMIIEDNEDYAEALRQLLEPASARISVYNNGETALRLAAVEGGSGLGPAASLN